MILVNNTPRNAGVTISGDVLDFEELYEALHTVLGEEGEFPACEAARLRVLGFCYDLRHAMMGDREIQFVENGLDQEKMKRLSVISNGKNVYLSFKAFWPEMLFICVALDRFIWIYRKKRKHPQWDLSTAAVQKFQASVVDCLRRTLPRSTFIRTRNVMSSSLFVLDGYITQYLDVLNCKFLAMDADKRLKNISIMAKRIVEQGDEYQQFKSSVLKAARQYNCPVEEIEINVEYPDSIDW